MHDQHGNVNREIETIKENLIDILELKNTIIELTYSLEGFNSNITQIKESNNLKSGHLKLLNQRY